MRKPRDFDAELKALDDKAKNLRQCKVAQLGELVVATATDSLPVEELAGALLTAADTSDFVTKEEWRKRGEAFFRGRSKKASGGAHRHSRGGEAHQCGSPSPTREAGAA